MGFIGGGIVVGVANISESKFYPSGFYPHFTPYTCDLRAAVPCPARAAAAAVGSSGRLPSSPCPWAGAGGHTCSVQRRLGPTSSLVPARSGCASVPCALPVTGLSYRLPRICSASAACLACPASLFSPAEPPPHARRSRASASCKYIINIQRLIIYTKQILQKIPIPLHRWKN